MNFYLKESLNNISCLLKIMFVYTTIQSKIVRTKKKMGILKRKHTKFSYHLIFSFLLLISSRSICKYLEAGGGGEHVNPIIHIYVDFYVSYSKFCNVHSFSKYKDR